MTRRLPLLVGALAFASLAGSAEAGHVHFSGGFHVGGGGGWHGGVHVSSYGSYHWSRPAWTPTHWQVGGHIWVGGGYYYPRPYYYYYTPAYVPSYYSASYYPVSTESYTAPGVTEVYVPPPPLPKLGIGLFAGGVNVSDGAGNSIPDSNDVGILGRLRLGDGGLLLEGELGKTSYQNDLRVDRRLGGSLIYEIGARNALAPYVLVGTGVQQANVNGDYSTTQDFVEVGVGLRLAITPKFHIAADIRAGSRSTVSNDAMPVPDTAARTIAPPTSDSGMSEDYTRGRLSAILYF